MTSPLLSFQKGTPFFLYLPVFLRHAFWKKRAYKLWDVRGVFFEREKGVLIVVFPGTIFLYRFFLRLAVEMFDSLRPNI
jgi:hypothetical protein